MTHRGSYGLGSDDNRCVICGKHIMEGTEVLMPIATKRIRTASGTSPKKSWRC